MSALRTTRTDSAEIADSIDTGGDLQIGDQWNAITILAHSQTHPLKAVCELTENAIDAGAISVEFQRFRKGGETWMQITDDGGGVILNEEGLPDFRHIATHICDSMKRSLTDTERKNIHGEYGIGLLSFWTLGRELRMASPDRHGSYRHVSKSLKSSGGHPSSRPSAAFVFSPVKSPVFRPDPIQAFIAATAQRLCVIFQKRLQANLHWESQYEPIAGLFRYHRRCPANC